MTINHKQLQLESHTQFELLDITEAVRAAVALSGVKTGVAVVFAPHTTASVRINHNEPLLKQDLMKMLYRLAPIDMSYAHDFFEVRSGAKPDERSNGHAHVKAFLLGQSQSVPIKDGQMILGDRQSIFFVELDGGRKRRVEIEIIGE